MLDELVAKAQRQLNHESTMSKKSHKETLGNDNSACFFVHLRVLCVFVVTFQTVSKMNLCAGTFSRNDRRKAASWILSACPRKSSPAVASKPGARGSRLAASTL